MAEPSRKVERIMLATVDPEPRGPEGETYPALSSMLHRVCQDDPARFEEATRLIRLFIERALADG